MICASNLRKVYDRLVAVEDLSLDLVAGETFGLLGPNGAGKTTTIHMLVGALRPDAGIVTIHGEKDPTRPAVRRLLGIAPQKEALYEELSGAENLAFFGRLYGLGGRQLRERLDWALEFAGLADRRRHRVKTYSGGMKRRLNLACALVHDPPVVLLDEPTAGVDPQSRNHLLANIEELARQGRTILYTTHYMEEAARLCQRVAIMDHGRILALDSVDDLVHRHGGEALVEAELTELPAKEVSLPGPLTERTLRFATDRPFEEAARLQASGVRFATFRVERPNLETVFLNLTGRSLRD